MNCSRKIRNFSLLLFALGGLNACGVKGDPLPPEKPAELGRGRPTYKRATEGLKIEKTTRTPEEDEEDNKNERE